MSQELIAALAGLREVAERTPGLRLLVLFGSRARGDASESSDWDLGYIASDGLDPVDLHLCLVECLGTERLDLVDLEAAGGLLRYRAARDGCPIHEEAGALEAFWLESVRFWCDAALILQAEYEAILRGLPA